MDAAQKTGPRVRREKKLKEHPEKRRQEENKQSCGVSIEVGSETKFREREKIAPDLLIWIFFLPSHDLNATKTEEIDHLKLGQSAE